MEKYKKRREFLNEIKEGTFELIQNNMEFFNFISPNLYKEVTNLKKEIDSFLDNSSRETNNILDFRVDSLKPELIKWEKNKNEFLTNLSNLTSPDALEEAEKKYKAKEKELLEYRKNAVIDLLIAHNSLNAQKSNEFERRRLSIESKMGGKGQILKDIIKYNSEKIDEFVKKINSEKTELECNDKQLLDINNSISTIEFCKEKLKSFDFSELLKQFHDDSIYLYCLVDTIKSQRDASDCSKNLASIVERGKDLPGIFSIYLKDSIEFDESEQDAMDKMLECTKKLQIINDIKEFYWTANSIVGFRNNNIIGNYIPSEFIDKFNKNVDKIDRILKMEKKNGEIMSNEEKLMFVSKAECINSISNALKGNRDYKTLLSRTDFVNLLYEVTADTDKLLIETENEIKDCLSKVNSEHINDIIVQCNDMEIIESMNMVNNNIKSGDTLKKFIKNALIQKNNEKLQRQFVAANQNLNNVLLGRNQEHNLS